MPIDLTAIRAALPAYGIGSNQAGEPLKATLLDTLSRRGAIIAGLIFYVFVIITLLVGAGGPTANASKSWDIAAKCDTQSACNSTMFVSLNDLNQWKQVTWVTAQMSRPVSAVDGSLINKGSRVEFFMDWALETVKKDGTVIATNSTHTVRVVCEPNKDKCSSFIVFAQVLYAATSYDLVLRMSDPFQPWRNVGGIEPVVTFSLTQGWLNEAYTTFEAGWKVFYVVITTLLWLQYMWALYSKSASVDEAGKKLYSTQEQIWVAVLGAFLFWFNDPLFISYLVSPSLASAGFSALMTSSFIALLLFFFLCVADNARLEGSAGLRWKSSRAARARGALYWIPKVLICSIIWALSIALYVFQRLAQLSDPSFTYVDTFGPEYTAYAANFIAGIGSLYVIYLFVLFVLA